MAERSIVVKVIAQVGQYITTMGAAAKATKEFGTSSLEAALKHRDAMDRVGKLSLGAGLALGVIAVASVMAASEFDKQMSVVKANIDDKSVPSMKRLADAALEAGRTTTFSATEAGQAEEELAKAGLHASEITGGALTASLNLAAAAQIGLGDSAAIVSSTMVQFNLKAKDAGHIADVLAAGADKALGGVSDLGEALKYAGVPAAQFGISLDETAGTLALFAQNGILGSMAGTSLRQMLISVANPTTAAANEMKNANLQFFDAQGKFKGVAAMAEELKTKLAGMTDEQRNATLATIFGSRSLSEASILYKGGATAVKEWTNNVNDQGFAAGQAATKLDNLSGDMTKLKNSINVAMIETGQAATGPLRGIVREVTAVVNAYSDLPDGVKGATLAIGGGSAAALLAIGGFMLLSVKIAETAKAFKDLGIAARLASFATPLGAALGLATVALGFFVKGQIDAAAASADLRGTLDQTTGAVTDQTHALIGARLQEITVTDDATGAQMTYAESVKGLGVTLGDMIGVVEGNADATAKLDKLQSDNQATLDRLAAKHGDLTQAEYDQLVAAQAMAGGYDDLKSRLTGLNGDLGVQVTKQKELGAAVAESATAADGQSSAALESAKALKEQEDAAKAATTANNDLVKAMQEYGNLLLAQRDSTRGFYAAVDAASAALKENGKTLDITTDKGRKNQSALDGISSATLKMVADTFKNRDANTSLASAVKTATDKVNEGRDAFIKSAVGFGMSKTAAGKLADQLGLTTGNVKTLSTTIDQVPTAHNTTFTTNAAAVTDAVNGVRGAIALLQGKSITIKSNYVTTNSAAVGTSGPNPKLLKPPGANARGTSNWRGGPTWVGEEGPELLELPTGSRITSAQKSAALVQQGSVRPASDRGSNSTAPIFNAYGLDADQAVQRAMRQWEHNVAVTR